MKSYNPIQTLILQDMDFQYANLIKLSKTLTPQQASNHSCMEQENNEEIRKLKGLTKTTKLLRQLISFLIPEL